MAVPNKNWILSLIVQGKYPDQIARSAHHYKGVAQKKEVEEYASEEEEIETEADKVCVINCKTRKKHYATLKELLISCSISQENKFGQFCLEMLTTESDRCLLWFQEALSIISVPPLKILATRGGIRLIENSKKPLIDAALNTSRCSRKALKKLRHTSSINNLTDILTLTVASASKDAKKSLKKSQHFSKMLWTKT